MCKCNKCGAVESSVAILFGVICSNCFSALPSEARQQVIEEAAARSASEQPSI